MSRDMTNQVLGSFVLGTEPRPKAKGHYFVVNLSCSCGWCGVATNFANNPKFLGKDSKGCMYFKCPSCHRLVQYDCWRGTSRTRGQFWSLLHRRFS